jgi:membrane protein
MKINLKRTFTVFKTAFKEWSSKDPFRESAVIAYYAIFSLPGLLVLIISLAGYFFGKEAVSGHIYSQVSSIMGSDTAKQVEAMIAKASEMKDTTWATIVGIVTIIVGATGVFAQFQKSLNVIWEVKADSAKKGIWSIIRVRLFSFGLIISIAFILLISLVITSVLSAIGEWVRARMPEFMLFLFQALNFLVSLAVISLLFALMFKFLPDAKIKWRDVWIGSIVTALLFDIGKSALGFYFGKANPGEGYGPAGSIILILLWVSYTSMIVFYGAEYTRAYADRFEKRIKPSDHAVKDPDPKRTDHA